jgi:DNA polymerase
MSSDEARPTVQELASSLHALIEYERAMGQDELLRVRGSDAPEEPESEPACAEPVSPDAAMTKLRADLGDCTRCPLHHGRNSIVFGAGNPRARLVFVGEGPGRDEDLQGLPFVGAAGQLLTRIIEAIGFTRDEVYICNVVKCRPPSNRTPAPEEQAVCGPFLDAQLENIAPDVVVALGATAAGYLLGTDQPVGRLRGRFHPVGNTGVMVTYHPAYLLRTPEAKRAVWEDMKMVRDRLGSAR